MSGLPKLVDPLVLPRDARFPELGLGDHVVMAKMMRSTWTPM
jgi:hypothetical protein